MPKPIRAKPAFRTHDLAMGLDVPRVVGVLCSLAAKFPPRKNVSCDLVEVRFDKTSRPADWLERCQAIEAQGWPVLLTVRLQAEGGDWTGPDEDRLAIFEQGLRGLAGVDIELRSRIARRVGRLAGKLRKVCVVSYHDFKKTPSPKELEAVITEAQEIGSIVKISTRLNSQRDENVLRSLLARKWKCPLCVIGMGTECAHTRVSFPRLGSVLTYGYLDKPTAPGQISAAELTRQLSKPPRQH